MRSNPRAVTSLAAFAALLFSGTTYAICNAPFFSGNPQRDTEAQNRYMQCLETERQMNELRQQQREMQEQMNRQQQRSRLQGYESNTRGHVPGNPGLTGWPGQ